MQSCWFYFDKASHGSPLVCCLSSGLKCVDDWEEQNQQQQLLSVTTLMGWSCSGAASVVLALAAYLILLSICLCSFIKIQLQFGAFSSTLAVREGPSCLSFQTLPKTKGSAKWFNVKLLSRQIMVTLKNLKLKHRKFWFVYHILLFFIKKTLDDPFLSSIFFFFYFLSFSVSLDTFYIYINSFSRFYPM